MRCVWGGRQTAGPEASVFPKEEQCLGGDTGLCAASRLGLGLLVSGHQSTARPHGRGRGDAQAAAPGVCGEAEPASFHLPAAESKSLTEEKIYFLMTSEPSPCAACVLPASCEHSKLVCKYWLEAAGGKKTRRSHLFVRDSEGPRTLALLPLGKGLSQGPPRRPSTEAVSKDSARVSWLSSWTCSVGNPLPP